MKRDVWIFLLIIGLLFFNWPIMSIFKNDLVIALFVIWIVFILLIFTTSFLSDRKD